MHLDIPSILSALPTWPIQSPEPVPAPPPEYISLPAKLPVDIARRMIDYYEPIEFPDLVAQVFAPFRAVNEFFLEAMPHLYFGYGFLMVWGAVVWFIAWRRKVEIVVDDSYPEWKRESDTLGIYKYGLFNTLKGFILCERPAEGGEKIRVPVPACSVVEVTVKQPGELFGVVRGLRTLPPSHRELLGLKESEQPGTRLRGDQDPSPGRRAWKHLLYHGTRLKGKANVSDHFSEEEQGLPVDGNLFEEGFSRMGIRESSNESLLPRLHDPQEQSLGSVEKEEDTDGIPIELLPRTRASKKPRVAPPPTARAEEDEDEFRRGFKEAYDGSHSVAMVRRKEGRRKGEKLARFDVEAQHPIEMAAGKHSWGYVAGFRAGTTAFQDELKAKQHALGIGENGMPIYVWREDEFGRYPEKIVK